MTSARANIVARLRRFPQPAIPVVLIVAAVVAANIFYLVGIANIDPISWTAGISRILCNVTCGRPMIDPNVGYLTQPLGHLAAMDLLHGHLPWWNHFEGLGQPLAGEMQSAALFPLVLLFALPSGLLWFHMSLEIIAGLSTYFLARRLSMPVVAATCVGVLFALNGTIAWLGNAVLNPVAFLPMLLLGIEMIFDGVKGGSRKGWYVAAIALALSLYAGFPEVAYFDGLFCAGWAAVRFFSVARPDRLLAARRLCLAGVVGLLLSLPILVPFYDFMKVANVGGHAAGGDSATHLANHAISMFIDPYVYGLIFANPNASPAWGGIGGYFTFSAFALALLGLFGARLRPLRIFLGAWALVGTLSIFNVEHLRQAWNILPLASSAELSRYLMPSCEMAIVVLAGLGIMDFAKDRRAKRLFTTTTVVALAALLLAAYAAHSWNDGLTHSTKTRFVYIVLDALPFVAALMLLVVGRLHARRYAPLLVALVVAGESLLMFQVPTVGGAKKIVIDTTPIQYLQAHQGQDRFLDLGILTANWASQFNLKSLSAIDLPFPNTFASLISTQLYPGFTPVNQFVIHGGMTGITAQEDEVALHIKAYEGASVKYLLAPNSIVLLPQLTSLGVKRVYEDSIVAIYQLPTTRPYYSSASSSCTVTSTNDDDATVSCPKGGSTLVRTELFMAGWHASVNGKSVPITKSDGAYQSITVPSGTSSVTFSFMPAHEELALLAALLAALFTLYTWLRERFPARRRRHQR